MITSIAQYNAVRKALQNEIAKPVKLIDHAGIGEAACLELADKVRRSKVPELNGPKSPSTAMFPVESEYWVIGCFGSVWLDTAADGKLCRIAWAGGGKFVVQEAFQ